MDKNDDQDLQLKLRLSRLPQRPAPAALVRELKREYIGHPLWAFWKPIGVLTMAAAGLALWLMNHSPNDEIDLETLVASHTRYSAESLVPPADMVSSNFSAHLASYERRVYE